MKRRALISGTMLLLLSSVVLGHVGATGVVKQRMDDMELIGRALKRIGERVRSGRELAAIAPDAEAITAAAIRMPSLFPPGSRDGHTEAKATIWERWPEFTASARSLAEGSEKLAAAARSGQGAEARAQLRLLSRTCADCHDAFRARR